VLQGLWYDILNLGPVDAVDTIAVHVGGAVLVDDGCCYLVCLTALGEHVEELMIVKFCQIDSVTVVLRLEGPIPKPRVGQLAEVEQLVFVSLGACCQIALPVPVQVELVGVRATERLIELVDKVRIIGS